MKKNENSELLNLNVQGYLFQCLDDSRSGYLLEWLDRELSGLRPPSVGNRLSGKKEEERS